MIAGLKKLAKGLLFGGDGSLSSSRVVIFVVLFEINALVVLCVAWVWHVTATGQMEAAAPLAQAVFTGVAAVLGAQATMAAVQYAAQYKWGPGSYSGRQADIDQARVEIAAADAEMGMSSPPGLVPEVGSDIVPASPSEPRVAAESQSGAPSSVLTVEDPIEVEIVEPTSEKE